MPFLTILIEILDFSYSILTYAKPFIKLRDKPTAIK